MPPFPWPATGVSSVRFLGRVASCFIGPAILDYDCWGRVSCKPILPPWGRRRYCVRRNNHYDPAAGKRSGVRTQLEARMEDQISIPTLHHKSFLKLVVCCQAQRPSKTTSAALKHLANKSMVARVSPHEHIELFGGGRVPNHIHINLCRWDEMPGKERPVPLMRIRESLMNFMGARLTADISAFFVTPLKQLPLHGLVRRTSSRTTYAGLGVKQTSQTLTIVDGPVSALAWRLDRDEKNVAVRIDANGASPFYGEMLSDFSFFMWRMFNYLILEEKANVFTRLP
jgi:hypothetical protein